MATFQRTYGTGNDYIAPSDGFSLYVIDGGAGTDTVFADTRSTGFTVSPIDSNGMVTVSGASGTTLKLTNVEKMSFKDGVTLTLPTAAPAPAPAPAPVKVTGTSGNDKLSSTSSNVTFDGGAGIDTVSFANLNKASATITKTASGFSVSSPSIGTDTLTNVERIQFANTGVALDLDGNAGVVAKLIGAVFGKDQVANKDYVKIGLAEMDKGSSYLSLAKLAMDARVGANADAATVVRTLYTNVAGTGPSQADLNNFVNQLNNGTYTVASLTQFAAEHQANVSNVNLVGLSQTGLEFNLV